MNTQMHTRLLACFAACVLATHAHGFAEATAPLTFARDCPLVQVHVNEAGSYVFLLDTCLRLPVLDAPLAERLGLTPSVAAPGTIAPGTSPQPYTAEAALRVASIAQDATTVVVADLTPLRQRLGAPVAGLFPAHQPGYELILDFPGRAATWRPLEQAGLTHPGDGVLPVSFDESGAPRVEAVLDGKHRLLARVDTAFAETLAVGPEDQEAIKAALDGKAVLSTMLDPGGDHTARHARLDLIEVGGAKVHAPVCLIATTGTARLGVGFLKQFRVTINYEHGLLRWERDAGLAWTDPPLVGYGLALGGLVDGLWTIQVAAHSPASEAGVRTGDRLLAVDGVSAAHVPAETLEPYLRGATGQERTFTIDRLGQPVDVRLAAARLL
ncbi:MAG TPA: PDZ domain-containing protein [Candidatus Hydrogenedentes bacterium]|nr:PDZ domain-containing protein [Candidatus Hydrogenedentota bacterium]